MERLRTVVLLVFCGYAFLFGQHEQLTPQIQLWGRQEGNYGFPGSHLLRQEETKLLEYLREHPELQEQSLLKRTAWNFQVGSKGPIQSSGWWATNLETNSEYLVPSTCRAVGTNCYIFVEDEMWTQGRVDQAAVDSIRMAWDLRTPANANKGIFQTDIETFGNPPNIDNDAKIIILILDIRDGFSGSGGFVAGYFFSLNQINQDPVTISGATRRSNRAEIYYVDANPINLKTSSGLTLGMQTAAHEFQHMIHYNYDPQELTFINEACSQVAELVCGYPYTDQARYTDDTDVYLLGWNSSLADYSRATRWALYLWNQFPNNYLRNLVQNSSTGVNGMNNAFAAYPTTRRFDDVFIDWLIANHLNDASVDPRYGYTFTGSLTKPKVTNHPSPNTGQQSGFVSGLAADYISFTSGSNLSITFTSAFPNIAVKAVKVGASGKVVQDVPLNVAYTEPGFGTTYTTITFIVINTSQSAGSTSYGYQATGTSIAQSYEIKYDDGQPEGFLGLAQGDVILVYFTGIQGTKLDSVRVAFRRAGNIRTTVSRFNETFNPSPIGQILIPEFTVTSTDSTSVPYPVPYRNWVTVDLRSANVDASTDFAVSFVVGSTPSAPAVMISSEPDDGDYHSFTYSQANARWVVYSDANNPGNVFKYVVRAYVSTDPVTNAGRVVELLPKSFTLHQNYPNPFNPATVIRYFLPDEAARHVVSLRVYNMLGQEVTTLVDAQQEAGEYRVQWNADGLPSGVYYYRLQAGSYSETRKMLLLR